MLCYNVVIIQMYTGNLSRQSCDMLLHFIFKRFRLSLNFLLLSLDSLLVSYLPLFSTNSLVVIKQRLVYLSKGTIPSHKAQTVRLSRGIRESLRKIEILWILLTLQPIKQLCPHFQKKKNVSEDINKNFLNFHFCISQCLV